MATPWRTDMLTVGDKFPRFSLTAVNGTDPKTAFTPVTNNSFAGKWLVVFAWPKDFTFVCPTEIVGFNEIAREFKDRDAQLLGLSIDSEYVQLASALGILDKEAGVALRATFIVDPEGVIRFASVNDLSVGRNPQEVLRVLDALQTDELCPCNWQKGEEVLKAA